MENEKWKIPDASGILLIDKAAGGTSHDAVNQVRRLYGTKQVGHTGTLDPMATGLLTVLVGRAVKASEFAMSARKRYVATLRLGITTDTEDTTGKVLTSTDDLPAPEAVMAILPRFTGQILQTPPMVSAIKVGGEKLMDLARRGIEIERQARPITIHRLTAEPIDPERGEYRLDVTCSKGTYIRTLCADIGRALGCGGAMAALRRVENGIHTLAGAVTLERLCEMDMAGRESLLRPVEEVFDDCPIIHLPAFFARLAHDGNPIYLRKLPAGAIEVTGPLETIKSLEIGDLVRLYDGEGFFSVAQIRKSEDGTVAKPVRKFR